MPDRPRPEALARLGAIAACHHERLDGTGYHRSLPGSALSPAARILAAADAYHAMTEARPYREALARGATSRDVAKRLVIADKTARNHIERIYSKLRVSTRAEASLYAMRHGLVE